MLTVFCMKSFGTPPPPLPDCKIGLGPGALSYQEIESSQPLLDLSPCVVIPFVSDSIFVLLFCLSLCAIWHLANTTNKSVPWGKAALSWLLGGTVGHGGLTHTLLKLILLCPFSMWVKHCSSHCFTVLCFPWQPQCQDAKVLEFLLLVTGNRCHLLDIYRARKVLVNLRKTESEMIQNK